MITIDPNRTLKELITILESEKPTDPRPTKLTVGGLIVILKILQRETKSCRCGATMAPEEPLYEFHWQNFVGPKATIIAKDISEANAKLDALNIHNSHSWTLEKVVPVAALASLTER